MGTDRERLREAYAATAYRVHAGPTHGFVIRVGAATPEADALLAAANAESWAFVTAANPRSARLSDVENTERMARLVARVRERGLAHLPGEGAGEDSDWPAEPSLLVLGIGERDAVSLAREFDQHAIVAGRRGEPARLVWVAVDAAP